MQVTAPLAAGAITRSDLDIKAIKAAATARNENLVQSIATDRSADTLQLHVVERVTRARICSVMPDSSVKIRELDLAKPADQCAMYTRMADPPTAKVRLSSASSSVRSHARRHMSRAEP